MALVSETNNFCHELKTGKNLDIFRTVHGVTSMALSSIREERAVKSRLALIGDAYQIP